MYQFPITFRDAIANVGLPQDKQVGLWRLKSYRVLKGCTYGGVLSSI